MSSASSLLTDNNNNNNNTSDTNDHTCIELSVHEIVFSRTTLIIVLTLCVAITGLSLLILAAVGYRAWLRNREDKIARNHGRNSKYVQRLSMMRKEVDREYTRQYSGCLVSEPENPFLKIGSPVELGDREGIWEVDGSDVERMAKGREGREVKAKSLVFDGAKGQWFRRS
jgi:hypothetical protein